MLSGKPFVKAGLLTMSVARMLQKGFPVRMECRVRSKGLALSRIPLGQIWVKRTRPRLLIGLPPILLSSSWKPDDASHRSALYLIGRAHRNQK